MSAAPRTRLRPSAIGEPLVALLLQRVFERQADCPPITCACAGVNTFCTGSKTLQQAAAGLGTGQMRRTAFEGKLKPLDYEDGKINFDGAHRVDCLLFGKDAGLALEVKLGEKGLGASQVTGWFTKGCHLRRDSHGKYWIKGKMMAVLDRRWQHPIPQSPLIAVPEPQKEVALSEEWWLVVLNSTLRKWRKRPPTFSPRVHIMALEQIGAAAGGQPVFDDAVVKLVGSGFFDEWLESEQVASADRPRD